LGRGFNDLISHFTHDIHPFVLTTAYDHYFNVMNRSSTAKMGWIRKIGNRENGTGNETTGSKSVELEISVVC
jgi:hypothetical protein